MNKCHRIQQQAEICGNEIESYRGEIRKTSLVELANKGAQNKLRVKRHDESDPVPVDFLG